MQTNSPVQVKTTQKPTLTRLLQRKCACGNSTGLTGECSKCQSKKTVLQQKQDTAQNDISEVPPIINEILHSSELMQAKLTIGASDDPLEREADQIADRVMAAPTHSAVSNAPLHIQRFTGQATVQDDAAVPASVNHVLANPGRPLEPALQQDMEQCFGHDFSSVRVHTDAAAERSAQDVNAKAYTVGNKIMFGAGRFAPGTHEGRRLIAHELTHVVQQSGTDRNYASQGNEQRGLFSIATQTSRSREAVLQRDEAEEKRRQKAALGDFLLLSPDVAASWGIPYSPSDDTIVNAASSNVRSKGGDAKLMKKPVPLSSGWHKVIDEQGVILGYLYLSGGYHAIYDTNGKFVESGEIPLERPLIDLIDIAGGFAGSVRGVLRKSLSVLAKCAAPRIARSALLTSVALRQTVPIITGDVAPRAIVLGETLAAKSVPGLLRSVSGTAYRGAVSQGTYAKAASVIKTTATQGATSVSTQGATAIASSAASPAAQFVTGAVGATVSSKLTTPTGDANLDKMIDEAFSSQTFDTSISPSTGQSAQQGVVSVAPEVTAGFTQSQITAFKRILGRRFNTDDIKILEQLWNDAARPEDAAILNLGNSRYLFDLQRNRFWSRVAANSQARALFTDAGCQFSGGAPYYMLKGRRIVITIDHFVERQTAPNLALTAANLQLSFSRENSVVLRLLNQLDPFQ